MPSGISFYGGEQGDDMIDRVFSDSDLAAPYDAWWPRAQRKEPDLHLPLVMSAEAVLDAGCGTGALLHPVSSRGRYKSAQRNSGGLWG